MSRCNQRSQIWSTRESDLSTLLTRVYGYGYARHVVLAPKKSSSNAHEKGVERIRKLTEENSSHGGVASGGRQDIPLFRRHE